ncbi:scavenger receptor cysteine-rich type 1 protein M130 [Brachyistius frenatus]|uniref:scavenger receptor cysteine-rich type 1 protein M130 n=1 Tax=Brachyistius frenatus TaxID=100188 RepID=UPI0037E77884
MWFLILLLHSASMAALVSPAAGSRTVLQGDTMCEGHVQVFHGDRWGNVGDKYWNRSTEEVACRSVHCGTPVKSTDVYVDFDTTVWLNELTCKGDERALWDCHHPGWNRSSYLKQTVKKIRCSHNITISLDEHRCAGVVQYSTDGKTPAGSFCTLDDKNAERLCKSLHCGGFKELRDPKYVVRQPVVGTSMKIDCLGITDPKNLWQCAVPTQCTMQPVYVICKDHEQLQLKGERTNVCSGQLQEKKGNQWIPVLNNRTGPDDRCKQMNCGSSHSLIHENSILQLTCSDKVKVVLKYSGQESSCYGFVHVEVNRVTAAVCATAWAKLETEVVCRELGCGSAMSWERTPMREVAYVMDLVKCMGNESSLWFCKAKRSKVSCSTSPYIMCSGSVNVRLVDGPGRCAGRLEVQHEAKWKRVNSKQWSSTSSDIICRQMGCGNMRNTKTLEKFSQGTGDFLNIKCKPNDQKISDCAMTNTKNQNMNMALVEITCEEHKVVFLSGACRGEVGIEHGTNTSWLSGSIKTWNQEAANEVCRLMHCGEASSFTSKRPTDAMKDVCSPSGKSVSECDKVTNTSDGDRVAHVTCSETIEMNLTDSCWGHVRFCLGGECGGVCADTWTDEKSVMLCEALGCGGKVLKPHRSGKNHMKILINSLHTTNHTSDLRQCNFIKDGNNTCNKAAYVVCSGSIKASMNSSRDKCSGNVAVLYEGRQLPVCMKALTDRTAQNTICKELNCGAAVGTTLPYFGPSPRTAVISSLRCSDESAGSLKACDVNFDNGPCDLGGLRCSEARTLALEVNEACSGEVVVHSGGNRSFVSSDGWTEVEGRALCRELSCGNYSSKREIESKEGDSFWTRTFSCGGVNPENMWQCEKQRPPSQKKKLFIECQDEPVTKLSEQCGGEVRINGVPVCGDRWNRQYANRVCQELNCSNAVYYTSRPAARSGGTYHHVRCDKHHFKLGQCNRVEGTCDSLGPVSVYCTEKVKFNITDKCRGLLQVNYRNQWENMCFSETLPERFTKQMFEENMNCTLQTTNEDMKKKTPAQPETFVNCTEEFNDVRHCIETKPCGALPAVRIDCCVHTDQIMPPCDPTLPIVLGVVFSLVLLVLIALFVRFFLQKKAVKSTKMLPGTEVEFESGDYEDVVNKSNEMDDFSHDRFKSEAELITENDVPSTSSLPLYDDIDEMMETQPLTSPGAAVAAGDDYMHEDGVTYEVDELQDNYDDIDAEPEITQTEAEVHENSRTSAQSAAAAPPDLVEGDDDYLVPGQDG